MSNKLIFLHIKTDAQSNFSRFLEVNDEHFDKYLICLETGTETGKVHLQGIVEVPGCKGENKLMKYLRQQVKGCLGDDYTSHNQFAWTYAKKDENLSKYILKDGDIQYRKGYDDDFILEHQGKWVKREPRKAKVKTTGVLLYVRICQGKRTFIFEDGTGECGQVFERGASRSNIDAERVVQVGDQVFFRGDEEVSVIFD
jgi:hypothetical protein